MQYQSLKFNDIMYLLYIFTDQSMPHATAAMSLFTKKNQLKETQLLFQDIAISLHDIPTMFSLSYLLLYVFIIKSGPPAGA